MKADLEDAPAFGQPLGRTQSKGAGAAERFRHSLSVIIPAFNEAQRISSTLQSTAEFLEEEGYDWEIIVVDDGSSDDTVEVVAKFSRGGAWGNFIRVVSLHCNQGKGAAVRKGILSAKNAYCLICDADQAVPISDIQRLWPSVRADGDGLVIGSRNLPRSKTVIQLKWYRKILGRGFNALLARLAPGIYDTQCGFKLLPSPLAKKLAMIQVETGFAFDVEYLHLALRSGWEIYEVSVNWQHVDGSKVRVIRDSARMFASIVRIWFRSKIGAYGPFPIEVEIQQEA